MAQSIQRTPERILVLDIGGSHVHVAVSPLLTAMRIPSGPEMGPDRMMRKLEKPLKNEQYDAVAVGFPGIVAHGRIVREPHNLRKGWVGFDLEKALGKPTRIANDAAMQALGSYQGGRMLFLGLGTGLGSAMIVDGQLAPMELAHLPYKKGKTFEDYVGEAALLRLGRKKWQKEVFHVVEILSAATEPDYVVLGGGNVRKLKELPPGSRQGDNHDAFIGGIRLWSEDLAGRAAQRLRGRPAASDASPG